MFDHQGQISIHAIATTISVDVSIVFSYTLSYDVTDDTDKDNLATALSAQIHISVVLIGTVNTTISRVYNFSHKMGHYP